MDIHYRHILQICHIYSHIEHHSISSFINKSSAILNVKAIDSRVNCLCALCSMCVLDEYSVRIEYSERWACCTQPLSHSPIFLSGRNIPMTTVTTTMIVMHDFINIDAMCAGDERERVQRWSSLRTWKLSSLFSCWNFHRDHAQIWTVCVPILHTVINYGLQLLCSHPFSFPRLTLSLAGDCILHMFCSTNADIYQFCTKCNGDCNFHINGILPFIIKRGAFYIVVYKTR